MKQLLICLFTLNLVLTLDVFAQEERIIPANNRTYTEIFDSLSTGLISERIPYGVLYNRVHPWTDLTKFENGGTVSKKFVLQSWHDLENSVLEESYIPTFTAIKNSARLNVLIKKLPLLAIDYQFSTIDQQAYDDERLSEVEGILTDNNLPQHPFSTNQVTFAALAADRVWQNEQYEFIFNTDLLLSNTEQTVQEIKLTNLNQEQSVIIYPGSSAFLTFPDSGEVTIKIELKLQAEVVYTTYQKIIVRHKKSFHDCSNPPNQVVKSTIPFQGYDETVATTSIGNYTIYRRLKQGSSTDCEPKLEKPVIILDGFDPLDRERTTEDIYNLLSYNNSINHLGDDLLQAGYDVIILNFPVIGGLETGFDSGVESFTGNTSNGVVNRLGRDGGADHIERNAFVLVKLIQEINDSLTTNGSNEQLVVVGPSMGGQISRYALAYMEAKDAAGEPNMDHNTRLWGSFDSPHLGANIPLATHKLLDFFGNTGGQQPAKEALDQQLRSTAARQMLIEQLDGANRQAAFHQTYTSALTSNGLPGSGGYPQNLRKVSLVNGSGAGVNTSTPGAEFLNMEGKKTIYYLSIPIKIKVAELITNYLGNIGQTNQLFKGRVSIPGFLSLTMIDQTVSFQNNNPNGSMDIVPGGTYNSQGDIKDRFSAALDDEGVDDVKWHTYIQNHTFIPTVSALAFTNSAFNWSNRVDDRNLICNNEIPFDGYFMPKANEDHVFISTSSADWIKQEIEKGNPNCPDICTFTLTGGTDWICSGSNYTFSLDVPPPTGVTTNWTVGGGVSIVSSTNSSVTVASSGYNANTNITATLTNPCGADVIIKKQIGTGHPNIFINFEKLGSSCYYEAVASPVNDNYTYQWSLNGFSYTNGTHIYGNFTPGSSQNVYLKVTSSCNTTNTNRTFTIQNPPSGCMWRKKPVQEKEISSNIQLYPNPANESFRISGTSSIKYEYLIRDLMGRTIINGNFTESIEINSSNFSSGIYLVDVISSEIKQKETIKLVIQ